MNNAVVVSGLSKRYRLGKPVYYRAFRDVLAQSLLRPFRRNVSRNGRESSFWALKDVSFTVKPGEVLGIVGRNGAGKSTLLKILSRITEPTEGQVEVYGRVGSLLEVGTGFHPELTGRENIFLNGAILGMKKSEIQRKLDEIVSFAETENFIDVPVKYYSSGMYVRLAFAVAAHLETEILIVDEVLAVGDGEFQKKCMGKMGDATQRGRTVLFVSHNMNSIRKLCKNCIWLQSGNIRMIGPTAQAVSAYESSFTQKASSTAEGGGKEHVSARFLQWEIVEPKAEDPHVLSTCGPVAISFLVQINKPVQSGYHVIALKDMDNRIMWGWAIRELTLEKARYEFVYTLPMLPLHPGPYFWEVELFGEHGASSGWKLLDDWHGIPELVVATNPLTHDSDQGSGILNVPCEFNVRALSKQER